MVENNPGTGENKPNTPGGDNQVAAVQTKLDAANAEITNAKQREAGLQTKVEEADKIFLSPDYAEFVDYKQNKKAAVTEPKGDVNYEGMDTKGIVDHMTQKVGVLIKKAVDGIGESMAGYEKKVNSFIAQTDVKMAAAKHPDFYEHSDAMVKLAETNPGKTSEELYKMVKDGKKLADIKKTEEEKEVKDKELKAFSHKDGVNPEVIAEKSLTREQVNDKVWEASFGDAKSL